MPTLNIGIDSKAAVTGGRNIRAELQKINAEAKRTIVLLSQMGKIQSWRTVKAQLDSMGKSSVKSFGNLETGIKNATKVTKDFEKAGKKMIAHVNDTVNTFGKASKQMNRFGTETKKSTSLINTWIGKYSIVMSGLAASIFVFQNVFLVLRKVVQTFNEFNDALGKLKLKLLGNDLKQATAAMTDFQASTRFSVTDFANGIDIMMQYGATTQQAMQNISKVSQFATITQQKFGTAARQLINILKQEKLSITEVNEAFAIYAAKQGLISSDMEYMSDLVENKLSTAFGKLSGTLKSITTEKTTSMFDGIAVAIDALATSINKNKDVIFTFFKNWAKLVLYGTGFGTIAEIAKLFSSIGKEAKKMPEEIPGRIQPTPSAWIKPDMTQKNRTEVLNRMYGAQIDAILEFEQQKNKIQANAIEDQIKADDKALKEKERALKELERLNSQYLKEQLRTETSDVKERRREEESVKKEEKRYMQEQLRHEERMIGDRLRAYQSLYRDMKQIRKRNFDFERKILKSEYNAYLKVFGKEVPELLEWFAYKQRELLKEQLIEEGGFFGGIRAGMMEFADDIKYLYQEWGKLGLQAFTGLTQAFEDTFVAGFKGQIDDVKDIWKKFTEGLLDSFLKILAKMATQALMAPIIVPIFGTLMGNAGTAMAKQALGISPGSGGNILSLMKIGAGGMYGSGSGATSAAAASSITPSAGYLSTLAPYLGAGALGALGYTALGKMVGLPQGKYSGIGAGLGAAGGMWAGAQIGMIGGPIGAIAGTLIGGVLGSLFGKHPRDMRAKGGMKATGDLLDFININAWGHGKHGPKDKEIRDAIQSSMEAIRDQYTSIFTALPLQYQEEFVKTFKWTSDPNSFYARGSAKHFQNHLKTQIKELGQNFSKQIQIYLTKQVKSYGTTQLETISKSAGFAMLTEDSPIIQFYNELVDIMNSSGRWNATEMQKYMDAISQMEGYVEDIASAVENAFSDVNDTIAKFELTDIQYELRDLDKWYKDQIETWESLKGILSEDELTKHFNDINKAFEYLKQETFDNFIDPLNQFFEDMSISNLAPVQSMEMFQNLLDQKILAAKSGNAEDLQTLMDYVKSDYLPFMKSFGEGDYNKLYTQLMEMLKSMADALASQFDDKTLKHIVGYQHGTDYVPKTGTYMLHQGEAVLPTYENTQDKEIHIHLEVDGRQIGYAVAKQTRTNSELIGAVRRLMN